MASWTKRSFGAFILLFLGLWTVSTAALATEYDFSNTFPTCSGAGGRWWQDGTTYTCYGSVTLRSGDSIAPSSSISVDARAGITLSGNNAVGSSGVPVNLWTNNGTIKASNGATIYGNLISNSGAINLTNGVVTGSLSTTGNVELTGGSVSANVSGRNGVTTKDGTTIGGNVAANSGDVSLTGGSVTGSVSAGKTVTTTKTDVGNGVSSSSSTVSITGGRIAGAISTTGGAGIVIKGATVNVSSISAGGNPIKISESAVTVSGAISGGGTDGVTVTSSTVAASSIAAGTNPVTISDSTVSGAISGGGNSGIVIARSKVPSGSITAADGSPIKISHSDIGSPTSLVNVKGNNRDSLLDHTTVYGDVTAGSWDGTLTIDDTSGVFGTCTPDHLKCNVVPVPCTPPSNTPSELVGKLTCVCDSFPTAGPNGLKNSSIFNADWLISTSDATGILPSVVNKGYLRLTDNTTKNAKAATVPGIFPAAGNYISVEFRHYAYRKGTPDAGDGIAVTLSDYTVPPVPGAYGGSLGYAQKTGIHDGFSGGWIGVGIDEYGNYQNPTEGRRGGPEARPQTVAVRGSGSGQSGYNWLAGTLALSPPIDNSASWTPSLGYTYQVIVDARKEPKQTAVAVNRNTGLGYTNLVDIPNVYAKVGSFTQSPVPQNWQISFTGSTGDATNIHEIGGLRICAQTVLPTTGGVAEIFAAIDENYGTPSKTEHLDVQNYLNGHIFTKLLGIPFKLNVAALDKSQLVTTYAASADKKVTVKLVDNSDALNSDGTIDANKDCAVASCSAACKAKAAVAGDSTRVLTFEAGAKDKGQKQSDEFTVKSVYRRLVAVISDDTASACSIDSFAVRPLGIASVTSSNATNTAASGNPKFKAGSTPFSLTATTNGALGFPGLYTGVMRINNAAIKAVDVTGTTEQMPGKVAGGAQKKADGVTTDDGTFPNATPGTLSSTATWDNGFTYSEVGRFALRGYSPLSDSSSPRGVYDDSWTIVDSVDTKGDCVSGGYANSKTDGRYGCNFGIMADTPVFGRFTPDHFNTEVVLSAGVPMKCPTGLTCPASYNGFVYAGQPFAVNVHAKNAADQTTVNYDSAKGWAKQVTLSAWDALGGSVANANGKLNNETVPAKAFTNGTTAPATPELITVRPNFTFKDSPGAPTDIYLRAVDTDAVTSLRGASSIEGGVKIVSGRVRVSSAYGSELLPLPMAATVQYFNAVGVWVTSTTDGPPVTPGTSDGATVVTLAPSYPLLKNGVQTSTTAPTPLRLEAKEGNLNFVLGKPSGGGTGTAEITPTVPSYLFLVPGKATFGVYKTPLIYRREVY